MNEQLTSQLNQLEQYFQLKQMDHFFKEIDQVLEQLETTHQVASLITFKLHKAVSYFYLQNLTLALQVLEELTPIIKKSGSEQQLIRFYNTFAAVYGRLQQLDKTYDYLQLAKEHAETSDDRIMRSHIYYNLSMYHYDKNDYETSLSFINQSIVYFDRQYDDLTIYEMILLLQTKIFIQLNQLEKAQEVLTSVGRHIEKVNTNYVEYMSVRAMHYEASGQHDTAMALLTTAIQEADDKRSKHDLYEVLCRIAKKHADDRQYLHYLKQYFQLKKHVDAERKQTQFAAILHYLNDAPYKEASWTDTLTSIYNRRYIEENYVPGKTILLFDLDRFKSINDTYGHLIGDEALKKVAQTLQQFFTPYDAHIARLGGDEFICLFDTPKNLETICEAFLDQIRAITIPYEQTILHVTISAGIFVSEAAYDLTTLLEKADEALYMSKKGGRNQFTILREEEDVNGL